MKCGRLPTIYAQKNKVEGETAIAGKFIVQVLWNNQNLFNMSQDIHIFIGVSLPYKQSNWRYGTKPKLNPNIR